MPLPQKSDVKNHLSRRIRKNILPFKPAIESAAAGPPIEEQKRSSTLPSDTVLPRGGNSTSVSISRKLLA